ncbi:MAG TPA: SDR family oxidoreductase [Methyloceanibacter sp.]|nr:SDR family oxidoreductase [Methyloceanibacter sp.]
MKLFCFGLGFSAETLAKRLAAKGWSIAGTARDLANIDRLRGQGYEVVRFTGEPGNTETVAALGGTTHLLHSIPPGHDGDPVLHHYRAEIAHLSTLDWIGYLSTVGVYGNYAGAVVDETAQPHPNNERTRARVVAESGWLALGEEAGRPAQVFRLAGIYGPGRSALDKLRAGTARRIVKPGQVFNRIHVEDIATVLEASIARPRAGATYNVADDEPAPPEDVIAYGAELLGMEPPPEVPFEEADLSPMARSFYGDSRRISNALIKSELGVRLAYPNYREGLNALAGFAS